ncbi:MAG: hypothetical protein ACRCSY_00510, partial [Cetobacterium sp.]
EYVMDFIWEKKPPRIAYNTLIGRPEEGGLGLVDVEQKKRSMRVKVVKKYLDVNVKGDWKSTMKHFLAKCGKGFLSDNILWMKLKNWMMEGIPNFYKEVLGAWSFFLKDIDFKPIGREVVLNQPIFLNKNIVFNGKEIFFKKWWEVGIRQVRDVLYEVKDGFLPIQVIIDAMEEGKEEYRKSSLQKQYEEVKSAVPKEWLNEIRKTGETERKVDVCMKIEDKVVEFNLCNVRMFYHCFIKYIFKKPNANQMWLRHFNGIEEDDIWKNTRSGILSTELECLDYFIRQNVIFTEMRLCIMGKESDAMCKICKTQDEGILHLFLFCEKLEGFFQKLKRMIKSLRDEKEDGDWNQMLILGVKETCKNNKVINLLLVLAKNAIWKRRNVGKRRGCVLDLWRIFKQMVEEYILTLWNYFKMEKNEMGFYKVFTNKVDEVLEENGIVVAENR